MSLRTDERGVSQVIGAVLLFGMLIIAFATYQSTIIPGQNTDIEAKHYQGVQDDLGVLQGTIVTAAETGEARSTSVNLGPSYPSRLFGVNAGPPGGQLRAESVGSGQINSADVPLDETCRLQAGGADNVPTTALVYDPGYNYYESGDVSHRLEETLLYQTESTYGDGIARNDQAMVDPSARTVTLYPLQSNVQSGGTGDETYRFVGGYGQSRTVSNADITIPTEAPVALWQEQIADGNPDITVADSGPTTIDISFAGSWQFNCQPVRQGGAPEQVPTADAGADTSVSEGSTVELDGTRSQATGSITDYSWTLTGSPPSGVSLSDSSTATPIFDATGADVSSNTDVTVELEVTDTNERTDTDAVTVTVTQTTGGSQSGPDDGTNTSPGDPGFAQCSNENSGAINFNQFNGLTIEDNFFLDDEFGVNQVSVSDNDGDNDLTQMEIEVVDSRSVTVATEEIDISGNYAPSGSGDLTIVTDQEISISEAYTVTAVAYDEDGNCVTRTLSSN